MKKKKEVKETIFIIINKIFIDRFKNVRALLFIK